MEDWDLRAVVRGRDNGIEFPSPITAITTAYSNDIIAMEMESPSSSFFPLNVHDQDDLFHTYPHLFETSTAFDELEVLYKPFYPAVAAAAVFTAASSSLSSASSSSFASLPKQAETQIIPKPIRAAKAPPTKYKKRKSELKRVVKEVKEEGLSSDMWAWRKYGQKPIKGSPYPRSYYRCSSSKGCSARKQVERSPSDPDVFIITYTADHSHAHPTRRNSLAGSTRSKFPKAPAAEPRSDGPDKSENYSGDMDGSSCKDHDDQELLEGESPSNETDMKSVALRLENNSKLFASLDDLERGLEELDEETLKLELFEGGFFDDDQFKISDANWFVDQYNTTISGAC